jgi:predicted acylesterase/phospholipase RssA
MRKGRKRGSDAGEFTARRAEIEAPLLPARYATLSRLLADPDTRTVVSFGGGSLSGLCGNLALAQLLEELGLRARVAEIWGTSAGAIIGGGWSTGTSPLAILDLVRSLDRRGALDFSILRFALAMLASLWPLRRPVPDGLLRGSAFLETIDAGLAVKTFEECPTPFQCIACSDDGHARRKVFRTGPLLPAIFASMSLPGIVIPHPVPQDGQCYYDGGLIEKTPLLSPIAAHFARGDGKKLLLIATHFGTEAFEGVARGFHQRFLASINALENLAWDYQLREARERERVTLMILNPRLGEPAMFDFSRTDRNYLAARARFADQLQNAHIALTFGAV